MKTAQVYVTESGKFLTNKEDGFIIYGAIFKADHESGICNPGEDGACYTNLEILDMLDIREEDIQRHLEIRKSRKKASYELVGAGI
jgi:hypothetical protein